MTAAQGSEIGAAYLIFAEDNRPQWWFGSFTMLTSVTPALLALLARPVTYAWIR